MDEISGENSPQPVRELFVICFAMFAGAFVAGLSCYKFNRRQLAWVNCFAAGVLLGTALGVIVPEGVRALYEDSVGQLAHSHDSMGAAAQVSEHGHFSHHHNHDEDAHEGGNGGGHEGHDHGDDVHPEGLVGKLFGIEVLSYGVDTHVNFARLDVDFGLSDHDDCGRCIRFVYRNVCPWTLSRF